MMGYIDIPVIDIEIPIYHYTNEDTLKKGAGHLFGSSLPVGGKGTHCVLSAHRGLPSAKLFSELNLVETGDAFYIHVLGKTLKYEVDQTMVVEPYQTESLAVSEGKDLVTLVTCTPYGINTHRMLIRGHRVENEVVSTPKFVTSDAARINSKLVALTVGIMNMSVILILMTAAKPFRRKHKRRTI
jgi:sortase A